MCKIPHTQKCLKSPSGTTNFYQKKLSYTKSIYQWSTRIKEHLVSDQNSHIFKHLVKSPNCKTMCTPNCFEILDSAKSTFDLKLQEAFDIRHKNPELNKQVHHIDTFLTL